MGLPAVAGNQEVRRLSFATRLRSSLGATLGLLGWNNGTGPQQQDPPLESDSFAQSKGRQPRLPLHLLSAPHPLPEKRRRPIFESPKQFGRETLLLRNRKAAAVPGLLRSLAESSCWGCYSCCLGLLIRKMGDNRTPSC